MLVISLSALYLHISQFFWPFLRILALFSVAPVLSEKDVNSKVKIGLALIMAFLISPGLPDSHVTICSVMGLWVGLQQLILGIAIGLTVQFIFSAVSHAGEIIGLQMGLSFATFYDLSRGQNEPVVARLLNLFVTLLFLTFDGHLFLINVLAESFRALPVSENLPGAQGFLALVQMAEMIFRCGLMLGLPVITLLLCVNLTLGLLNRLTPQLSAFVIGFPLSLGVGMLALSMIMYTMAPFFEHLNAEIFDNLARMLAELTTG